MVTLFDNSCVYKHPWTSVSMAFWRKYPNSSSPHIQSIDTFRRMFDPVTGNLTISRLIICENSWFGKVYGVEETICNNKLHTMKVKCINITGSSMLSVEENCEYKRLHEDTTEYTQHVRISSFVPGMENRVFQSFCKMSPLGMSVIRNMLV